MTNAIRVIKGFGRLKMAAARAAFARLGGMILGPEVQVVPADRRPFRLMKPNGAKRYWRPNPRGPFKPNGPVERARRVRQLDSGHYRADV